MKLKREKIMKLCEFDTSKAHKHICELAKDVGSSWLMSIPPQSYDSDMLLQEPLDHIDKCLHPMIAALAERVEQLEGALVKAVECGTDDFNFVITKQLELINDLATSPLDKLLEGEK